MSKTLMSQYDLFSSANIIFSRIGLRGNPKDVWKYYACSHMMKMACGGAEEVM